MTTLGWITLSVYAAVVGATNYLLIVIFKNPNIVKMGINKSKLGVALGLAAALITIPFIQVAVSMIRIAVKGK